MIAQIADRTYSMDCAIINLRQIKHGYSKENDQFTEAIYPALLEHIAGLI